MGRPVSGSCRARWFRRAWASAALGDVLELDEGGGAAGPSDVTPRRTQAPSPSVRGELHLDDGQLGIGLRGAHVGGGDEVLQATLRPAPRPAAHDVREGGVHADQAAVAIDQRHAVGGGLEGEGERLAGGQLALDGELLAEGRGHRLLLELVLAPAQVLEEGGVVVRRALHLPLAPVVHGAHRGEGVPEAEVDVDPAVGPAVVGDQAQGVLDVDHVPDAAGEEDQARAQPEGIAPELTGPGEGEEDRPGDGQVGDHQRDVREEAQLVPDHSRNVTSPPVRPQVDQAISRRAAPFRRVRAPDVGTELPSP